MSVYIDDFSASYGRMKMCHMIADTSEELLEMADKIGVARRWLQSPGEHTEHFDVCKSKRSLEVKAGATEVTPHELVARIIAKRHNAKADLIEVRDSVKSLVDDRNPNGEK